LDPAVKADRVANYAISMREEVELIAHSCGLLDPQALSLQHAFVINEQGQPSALDTHLSP
jgi:glutamate synthase domain-containing protein 2